MPWGTQQWGGWPWGWSGQCAEIGDHKQVALDLLPSQFLDSTNLRALIAAFIGAPLCTGTHGVQELENELWKLLMLRWISTAFGEQLDKLGEILGEPRLSDDDEVYRSALYLRITINTSQGEPERLIKVALAVADCLEIHLIERFPAAVEIFCLGIRILTNLERIQETAAGGVKVLVTGTELSNPFVFGVDRDASGTGYGSELPYGSGFGETNWPDEGGNFSELYAPIGG